MTQRIRLYIAVLSQLSSCGLLRTTREARVECHALTPDDEYGRLH